MEENKKLEKAHAIITQTGTSLFLTGKAGTGKTTFLKNLRDTCRKRMIVTAPTGIAAINAGGMTLHSFFQLDFGPFVPGAKRENTSRRAMAFSKEKIRIIRGLDLLVIDEISMVRADMLDAVDDVLRRYRDRNLPFGGVQLLLIGDLQQLPPVVTTAEKPILEAHYKSPYFFDSHALSQLEYATIELDQIYRQTDRQFIELLNAVRSNKIDANVLNALNSRCIPGFNPEDSQGYVRLTTHNNIANEINRKQMSLLKSIPYFYAAIVEGSFPESSYPADPNLELKLGAQVMFIKNDVGSDRRYFNGMLGRITGIDETGVVVTPTDGTDQINVEPVEWENVKYIIDEETKEITERREGVFRQLPLRPAWAITIHKSQGLTFDHAIIDASLAFTHGQTYVALSRCRTLEGMVLERPLYASSVITDPLVSQFMDNHLSEIGEEEISKMGKAYQLNLIEGMFNFRPLFNAMEGVMRLLKENFMRLYGKKITETGNRLEELRISLTNVADKFCNQVRQLSSSSDSDASARLNQRIKDACIYFKGQLQQLQGLMAALPNEHDNRKVIQKLYDRLDLYNNLLSVKTTLFETFAIDDFNIDQYLDVKAKGSFEASTSKKRQKKVKTLPSEESKSNPNAALFDRLCEWRCKKAEEAGVPAYTIAPTHTLLAVAAALPFSYDELLAIPGIGPYTLRRIGDELLDMIEDYVNASQTDIAGDGPHHVPVRELTANPQKEKKKKRGTEYYKMT